MSTPAVVPEVPTSPTPPEVTLQNSAAEILASHTAEKAQAATPAEPPAAPTTPAPVVEVKPYVITKNSDGSVNVDITEGGEKFTGSMEEVLEKVAASKAAGNTYIKTLKTPSTPAAPEAPATPAAPAQAWTPDETTSVNALNGMLTGGNFGDAVGIGLAQMFGTNDPGQVKQAILDVLQLSGELKAQKEISVFAQKAPDFPWAEPNTAMIVKELTDRGLPVNADNMLFAHNALKGAGRYQAVVAKPATVETPNPAPPNGGGNPPAAADYDPWKVPLHELEANIRAGR